MVLEVSEVEKREELKVEAEVAPVQGRLGQGQSLALNLALDPGLVLILDLESPGPGLAVAQGQGVARGNPEVALQGPGRGQPSQAAARGQALEVQQDRGLGQRVLGIDRGREVLTNHDREVEQNQDLEARQNQGQAVQGDQDLEVLPNLGLAVQQGQDRQARQDRDLREEALFNHLFRSTNYRCAAIVCIVWTPVPLNQQLNNTFALEKTLTHFDGKCEECCFKAVDFSEESARGPKWIYGFCYH